MKFTRALHISLAIPVLVMAAFFLYIKITNPGRSPVISYAAVAYISASIVELVAVPVTVKRLLVNPETRSIMNIGFTLVGSMVFLSFIILYSKVMDVV